MEVVGKVVNAQTSGSLHGHHGSNPDGNRCNLYANPTVAGQLGIWFGRLKPVFQKSLIRLEQSKADELRKESVIFSFGLL
jgi:hypothetical protein